MQLNYNILWIDNNSLWRQAAVKKIENCVVNCGFLPVMEECSNGKLIFNEDFNLESYDLIFMDYDLKEDDNSDLDSGLELIKRIRNDKIYSNIIFYSSITNDLPEKVKEQGIQNTYIFEREDFRDENIDSITEVIEFILNRANSINIMRGIIMAELANFDNLILDIIENASLEQKWDKIFNLITKGRQRFCKSLINTHADLKEQKQELFKTCENIRTKFDIDEIKNLIADENQSSAIFPSSLRADFLKTILNEKHIQLNLENDFIANYNSEIIQKRNKLGHCTNIAECSQEDFLQLRKNILKHRKNLEEIKMLLSA
ncbi:MAG: hypothetical protein ACLSUS_05560 [Opitutales bacterium]